MTTKEEAIGYAIEAWDNFIDTVCVKVVDTLRQLHAPANKSPEFIAKTLENAATAIHHADQERTQLFEQLQELRKADHDR